MSNPFRHFSLKKFLLGPQITQENQRERGYAIARPMALVLALGELYYLKVAISLSLYVPAVILALTACYYGSFFFSKADRFFYSPMFLIAVGNATIVTLSLWLGPITGVQLFLFSGIGFCLVLFSGHKKRSMVLALVSTVACFVFLEAVDYSISGIYHPTWGTQYYLRSIVTPGPFILLIAEVALYFVVNGQFENELNNSLRLLSHKNDIFKKLEATGKIGYWDFCPRTRKMVWSDQIFILHGLPFTDTVSTPMSSKIFMSRKS